MKKYFIILAIIIVVVLGYNYIYQDHRDIEKESASYTLTSDDLQASFANSYEESVEKYLDKTISVSGEVTEVNEKEITLDDKIFCTFNEAVNIQLNERVAIKGRCIGYDDLLEQVKIDQCVITKN